MTTVITGASGHVGGNLARTLLGEGRRVRALVRGDTRAVEGLEIELARGDVLDRDSLVRAFRGAGTVYHLAAQVSIDGSAGGGVYRVNVEGTRNVVDACLETGVERLVHFSSIHAICRYPMNKKIDESNQPADVMRCHDYDRSKVQGEREVLKAVGKGLDAVIVNPTGILGPHDHKPSLMGRVLLDLFAGRFPALVEGGFDWVDARDVAAGAVAAEKKGRGGERYILSGRYLTMRELGRLVEEVAGVRAPAFTAPLWLALLGAPFVASYNRLRGRSPLYTSESIKALQWNRNVCCDKACRELGYTRRPIDETIEDTYRWFKAAGKL